MGWNDYKRDCLFFDEENDMGAIVSSCLRYKQYGYCPCKTCGELYVSRSTVMRRVMEHPEDFKKGEE